MDARRRHERGEARQEVERLEDHVSRTADAEIPVRGGLRLHPLARAIVATLGDDALSLDELRAKLADEDPTALRNAVLDLAEHDVLTIMRAAHQPRASLPPG
jgi:hypothetical protein